MDKIANSNIPILSLNENVSNKVEHICKNQVLAMHFWLFTIKKLYFNKNDGAKNRYYVHSNIVGGIICEKFVLKVPLRFVLRL